MSRDGCLRFACEADFNRDRAAYRERCEHGHAPADEVAREAAIAPQMTLLELRSIELVLPFPPSVNDLYRAPKKTENASPYLKFLTDEQKEFRKQVDGLVGYALGRRAMRAPPLAGRIRMTLVLYPIDNRRFDIDNRIKAVLDALQKAKVFFNDEQIDRLIVDRVCGTKRGNCAVTLQEIAA